MTECPGCHCPVVSDMEMHLFNNPSCFKAVYGDKEVSRVEQIGGWGSS